jgi:hypothetical protein
MSAQQQRSGLSAVLLGLKNGIAPPKFKNKTATWRREAMDEQAKDYAVGYGKPPLESRFQKGQSGNPGGRRRGTKTLAALLGEALSRCSGLPNPDGSRMTQAEAIFATLVGQAAGPDLKAKKLLFDLLVKLQRANICWTLDRLPEIQLDESDGDARAEFTADIDRLAEEMRRNAAARRQAAAEPTVAAAPADRTDPIAPAPTP